MTDRTGARKRVSTRDLMPATPELQIAELQRRLTRAWRVAVAAAVAGFGALAWHVFSPRDVSFDTVTVDHIYADDATFRSGSGETLTVTPYHVMLMRDHTYSELTATTLTMRETPRDRPWSEATLNATTLQLYGEQGPANTLSAWNLVHSPIEGDTLPPIVTMPVPRTAP